MKRVEYLWDMDCPSRIPTREDKALALEQYLSITEDDEEYRESRRYPSPEHIAMLQERRICPRCGCFPDEGFDIGIDENGFIFGARCVNCGFSC